MTGDTTRTIVASGGNGSHGGLPLDRQVMFRALNAAVSAGLVVEWEPLRADVQVTRPGLCFLMRPDQVPGFLSNLIRSDKREPREQDGVAWDRLLDCMERLAEHVSWWEVA